MTEIEIETILGHAESEVARGNGLSGTKFWRAVGEMRRDSTLARRFGRRVASIDRRVFEQSVRIRVPAAAGASVLLLASLGGAAALVAAARMKGLLASAVFIAGFGAIEIGTHSLVHWLVGRLVGIRFTHFFLGGPPPPRPGAKVDYESYLKTPPRLRALMHGSGAVVTKLVPFALVPVALAQRRAGWVLALLLVAGAGQIITDLLFSTKTSDWKKVRRELRSASHS